MVSMRFAFILACVALVSVSASPAYFLNAQVQEGTTADVKTTVPDEKTTVPDEKTTVPDEKTTTNVKTTVPDEKTTVSGSSLSSFYI